MLQGLKFELSKLERRRPPNKMPKSTKKQKEKAADFTVKYQITMA